MLLFIAQLPFSAKFFSPPPKKPSTREREYLCSSEINAMIRAAKKVGRHGVRDGAIILLMFRHGLRTAELVALKWTQIDLAGGYIEVHRVKHGRDTIHPLRSPELRALRQIQRDYSDTSYVFVSERKAPLSNPFNSPHYSQSRKNSWNTLQSSPSSTTPCLRLLLSSRWT